jgi:flagellar protein FliS
MQTYGQTGYVSERALTASPLELIRMLYEGALSSIDLAIAMLHSNDIMARGRAITKAIEIIHELRASLRSGPQPEIASSLGGLYGYMNTRLLEAHARRSEEALLEVSRLLKCLYEGWLGVMRQLAEVPAPDDEELDVPAFTLPNPYAFAGELQASGRSWNL